MRARVPPKPLRSLIASEDPTQVVIIRDFPQPLQEAEGVVPGGLGDLLDRAVLPLGGAMVAVAGLHQGAGRQRVDRGLLGHVFNGYDTGHVKTDMRKTSRTPDGRLPETRVVPAE